MAGHSKWANIKRQKEKSDATKGKLFTRITKEILTAVKLGGSDTKSNIRLRLALQKAKACNMPYENIQRNIQKASSSDLSSYSELIYEIYGHGGVGMILEIMTDNKNRIHSDIQMVLNKKGGSLAIAGAVSYNFDLKGVLQLPKPVDMGEGLFCAVSDAGAEEIEEESTCWMITMPPKQLLEVKETVDRLGVLCESVELERIPKSVVECTAEEAVANVALIEALEHLDDVDKIYHNMFYPPSEE